MRMRNKQTGGIHDVSILTVIAGLLVGKIQASKAPGRNRTIRGKGRFPRNAMCFCGSGSKYKFCCGVDPEQKTRRLAARQA